MKVSLSVHDVALYVHIEAYVIAYQRQHSCGERTKQHSLEVLIILSSSAANVSVVLCDHMSPRPLVNPCKVKHLSYCVVCDSVRKSSELVHNNKRVSHDT